MQRPTLANAARGRQQSESGGSESCAPERRRRRRRRLVSGVRVSPSTHACTTSVSSPRDTLSHAIRCQSLLLQSPPPRFYYMPSSLRICETHHWCGTSVKLSKAERRARGATRSGCRKRQWIIRRDFFSPHTIARCHRALVRSLEIVKLLVFSFVAPS